MAAIPSSHSDCMFMHVRCRKFFYIKEIFFPEIYNFIINNVILIFAKVLY